MTSGTNGDTQSPRTDGGSTGSTPAEGDASHVVMIPEDEKDGAEGKGKKDKKKKKGKDEKEDEEKTKKKVRALMNSFSGFNHQYITVITLFFKKVQDKTYLHLIP